MTLLLRGWLPLSSPPCMLTGKTRRSPGSGCRSPAAPTSASCRARQGTMFSSCTPPRARTGNLRIKNPLLCHCASGAPMCALRTGRYALLIYDLRAYMHGKDARCDPRYCSSICERRSSRYSFPLCLPPVAPAHDTRLNRDMMLACHHARMEQFADVTVALAPYRAEPAETRPASRAAPLGAVAVPARSTASGFGRAYVLRPAPALPSVLHVRRENSDIPPC